MNRPRHQKIAASGFTIIETIIVLAIAGLILLIVFLAIPALERSSRNNQRRQDVQIILQAVSHYELNDSGNFPTACGGTGTNSCAYDTGNGNDNFLKFDYTKLTYYDPTMVFVTNTSATDSSTTYPKVTDSGSVELYNHAKCDPNNLGSATNAGASYSDVVALYGVESGPSATVSQCQQL